MARRLLQGLGATLIAAFVASCSGNPNSAQARQCSNGLDAAYERLDIAESNGFGGTVDWTKAASLLAAAKVQYEFEKYPNCIEKVNRANQYITASQGG